MAEEFIQGKNYDDYSFKEGKTREGVFRNEEGKGDTMQVRFDVVSLERLIDEMEQDLPRLESFILPGGGVIGAQLMVARAVCRRTEREYVRYLGKKQKNFPSSRQSSTMEGRGRKIEKQKIKEEDSYFLAERSATKSKPGNPKVVQHERVSMSPPFDSTAFCSGDKDILLYLNRLSDYLFVASRWVNWIMSEEEVVWRRNY